MTSSITRGPTAAITRWPNFDRAFPENNREQGEDVFVHKDGSFYPVAFTASPIRDEEAKTVGTIIEVRDISAEKAAVAGLRESERRLTAVLNNASVAIFMMDERQHCVYMNSAAERLTGFTLEETLGRPLHDVVHHTHPDGSHYPLSDCPIDRAFPENNQEQGEEVFVHKDGSFYPVAFTASPIRDDEAKTIGTIIEVRDISAEKAAEAELRESGERLALAVHAGRLGVHDYNPRSGAITWDDRVRELWGVSPSENVTYETFIRGVHPDDRLKVEAAITGALDPASGANYEAEFRVLSAADHSLRWIKAHGVVSFENGEPVRLVGTVHDISDRKHDEQRMRLMIGELAHRSKNLLAIVQAMVRQSARYADGFDTFTTQLESRVAALASAHDLLFEEDGLGVDLSDLVTAQLRPFVTLPDKRVKVVGPSIMIEPQATQYLALALHELATNSTKYGALSHPRGTLDIEWKSGRDGKGGKNFCFVGRKQAPPWSGARSGKASARSFSKRWSRARSTLMLKVTICRAAWSGR